jgi:CBS domain-containing protein
MRARDVMQTQVVTAGPDMTMAQLRDLLAKHRFSGAPVVDETGDLIGVVSLSDMARARSGSKAPSAYGEGDDTARVLGLAAPGNPFESKRVREVMSSDVVTAPEDAPVGRLIETMVSRKVHRVVVTNGRKVAGIVSTMDLLKGLGAWLKAHPDALGT